MITAYALSYANWTVVPHHIEESFRDMVDCGYDAVALSFSESEMQYARRTFEMQLEMAHRIGLKAIVVPSRLGGRFAGAPFAPSWWLASHPECLQPGSERWPVACLEAPEFREWIAGFMKTVVGDYPLDGIIWDEPKAVGAVSDHPATVKRFGGVPTAEGAMDGLVDFITWLTAECRAVRPELSVTLFCQKTDPEYFTSRGARIDGLEFFGYDGNLAKQSFFHEEPKWNKYRIESVWERMAAECSAAGVGTFGLVENMLMPASSLGDYEANLDAYLAGPLPDHLGIYYYAHNNEDPEAAHKITRRLMQKHLS